MRLSLARGANRTWHWLATIALALLLSCSESTAPVPPPTGGSGGLQANVTVQAVSPPVYSVSPDSVAILSCQVQLQATAQGSGFGVWGGAVFRFYPASDLRTAFDSVALSAQDILDSWGGHSLSANGTLASVWTFFGTIPFTAELEYRYRPEAASADSTASVQFTCRPAIPTNPTPPAITAFALNPVGGTINPGDTLALSVSVSAAAGIWQTVLSIAGSCDTVLFFPGHLLHTATYTASIPITPACSLNSTLSVSASVLDAAAKVSSQTPAQVRVEDHKPPTMIASYNAGSFVIAGDFFAGDTLNIEEGAADNDQVSYLTWEAFPSGTTASVPLNSLRNPPFLPVPIGPTWATSEQLRFTATDRSGNRSGFATINTDSMRIHPLVQRPTVIRTIAGDTRQILPDGKRGVFYLLLGNEQQLLTLSLSDASTIRSVHLPACGTSFDFAASGDSLLFTCPISADLGILDLTQAVPQFSLHRLITPDTLHGQWPGRVVGMANGKALIELGGPFQSQTQLLQVDLATGAESIRTDAGVGTGVYFLIERSPQHDRLLAGDGTGMVQVYNSSTDQFGTFTMPPNNGGQFWFSSDDQVIVEGTAVLDPSLQLLRNVRSSLGMGAVPTFLTPDGKSLFYSTGNGVIRAQVSDGQIADRTPLPILDIRDFRTTEDGGWVVFRTSEGYSTGQVGVIDLR